MGAVQPARRYPEAAGDATPLTVPGSFIDGAAASGSGTVRPGDRAAGGVFNFWDSPRNLGAACGVIAVGGLGEGLI
jgi:hypothetical protein